MTDLERNHKNDVFPSEDIKLKEEYPTTKEYDLNVEYIKRLIQKFGYTALIVNRLDYYANAIPLGAFCNAIAFILYGFQRCGAISTNDTFLWGLILLFGGIGQVTAGFLEFLKGRSFPANLYLIYGFYCLAHYATYMIPLDFQQYGVYGINYEHHSLAFFYGAWFFICLPIVICSLKVNLLFILQTVCTLLFFFFRWVGEIKDNIPDLKETVAGIFEVIAGFVSLYIFMNQIVNEQFRKQILPSFYHAIDNEIDIEDDINYQTPQ